MFRSKVFLLVLVALLVLLPAHVQAQGDQTIKIGFFSPLTGPAASDGKSALQGAQLAVETLNAESGTKIQLVSYDDNFKPDEAANVTRRLIEQDKVVGVVSGSYSSPTRAAATIAQNAGVPFISSYAIHPTITQTGEWVWRIGELATLQGIAGAELVVNKLKAKRVAVLIVDNDFGISLTDGFKPHATKLGAEIVYEKRYPLGEKDFRPLLRGIEDAKPDAIYATGYYNEASALVRQMDEAGLKIQVVGQEGYDTPTFIELAGKAAEGVVFTTYLNRDSERAVVKNFIAKYQEKFGKPADAVAAASYDAVYLLGTVARSAASTQPKDILAGLKSLKGFENAVTGPILAFTEGREVVRAVGAQIVKEGKFRFFWELNDPKLLTPAMAATKAATMAATQAK